MCCRNGDLWPGLPGEGQKGQGLLRSEGYEDPGRDPAEAGAARPQREGSAVGGLPPLHHTAVSAAPRPSSIGPLQQGTGNVPRL